MLADIAGGIVTVVIPLYVRDILRAYLRRSALLLSVLEAGVPPGSLVVGAVTWPWPLGR